MFLKSPSIKSICLGNPFLFLFWKYKVSSREKIQNKGCSMILKIFGHPAVRGILESPEHLWRDVFTLFSLNSSSLICFWLWATLFLCVPIRQDLKWGDTLRKVKAEGHRSTLVIPLITWKKFCFLMYEVRNSTLVFSSITRETLAKQIIFGCSSLYLRTYLYTGRSWRKTPSKKN